MKNKALLTVLLVGGGLFLGYILFKDVLFPKTSNGQAYAGQESKQPGAWNEWLFGSAVAKEVGETLRDIFGKTDPVDNSSNK